MKYYRNRYVLSLQNQIRPPSIPTGCFKTVVGMKGCKNAVGRIVCTYLNRMKTTDIPFILVVDDEEDICEIIKFNLESEGFRVDTANSAEEALQKSLIQIPAFYS